MSRYVAFLRKINVGGKNLIKMEDLREAFTSLGLENVKTISQSGNVIFDAAEVNVNQLSPDIATKLRNSLGYEVEIFLRSVDELQTIVRRSPFRKLEADKDVMLVIAFLSHMPKSKVGLPLESQTENLEVLAIRERAAFVVCRRKKTGWFAFPNNFIEKALDVRATTRQWKSVNKILAAAMAKPGA
jgi:uncharacterized protein (DUF1697 family)